MIRSPRHADEIAMLLGVPPRLAFHGPRGADLARLTATTRPPLEQAPALGGGSQGGAHGGEDERGDVGRTVGAGGVGHALTVGAEVKSCARHSAAREAVNG